MENYSLRTLPTGRQVCKNFADFAVKESDKVTESQSDKEKLISSSTRQLASF